MHTHKCKDKFHHGEQTVKNSNQENLRKNISYLSIIEGGMGRLLSSNITQTLFCSLHGEEAYNCVVRTQKVKQLSGKKCWGM